MLRGLQGGAHIGQHDALLRVGQRLQHGIGLRAPGIECGHFFFEQGGTRPHLLALLGGQLQLQAQIARLRPQPRQVLRHLLTQLQLAASHQRHGHDGDQRQPPTGHQPQTGTARQLHRCLPRVRMTQCFSNNASGWRRPCHAIWRMVVWPMIHGQDCSECTTSSTVGRQLNTRPNPSACARCAMRACVASALACAQFLSEN